MSFFHRVHVRAHARELSGAARGARSPIPNRVVSCGRDILAAALQVAGDIHWQGDMHMHMVHTSHCHMDGYWTMPVSVWTDGAHTANAAASRTHVREGVPPQIVYVFPSFIHSRGPPTYHGMAAGARQHCD